jgi:hypothetical protein
MPRLMASLQYLAALCRTAHGRPAMSRALPCPGGRIWRQASAAAVRGGVASEFEAVTGNTRLAAQLPGGSS